LGLSACLLKEVERVNTRRVDVFLEKIRRALWIIKDKQIGVLGLSFKAKTDDIRSSPAIALIQKLRAEGANVRAYDPEALAITHRIHPEITLGASPYEVAERCDALVVATAWDEFRQLDWERIRGGMVRPLLIDGRNLLNAKEMARLGFEYYCCGGAVRGSV
jgi:UDPglucose 6-dehydrogenase